MSSSVVNIDEKSKFEWQPLVTSSKIPPIRINSQGHIYKDDLILFLGAGAGVGRSQEVWKFNLKTLNWTVMEAKGDIPPARDGHTVTYVGKGKFILFGGQGVPYENEKSEKITETLAVKTYLVRELYNSMYQLDIDNEHWTRFEEDGTTPMGRRGHTMNFLPPMSKKAKIAAQNDNYSLSSSQDYGSTNSNSRYKKHHHHHEDLTIPDYSIILYGGSGIESSRYTEYYFNDLWVFNLKVKSWTRQRTKGFKPRALFDHRSEIVGDYLVVVGGLTGREGKESSYFTDVLTLNTKTCTWNSIDLYDPRGKSAKLKLHGFSMTKNTREDDNNFNPHSLIIFGGRETVEAKRAQTEGAGRLSPRKKKQKPQPTVFKLDIERGQLTPFKTKNEAPINRYGHIGVCSTDVDSLISTETSNNSKKKNSLLVPLDQNEPEPDVPLLYVYGGSATENGGFCDPVVYQLVRVKEKVNLLENLDTMTSANDEINSRPSTGSNFSVGDSTHFSGSHAVDDEEDQLDSRLSIWEKTQFQQMRSQDLTVKLDPNLVRNPSTWSELKLALSYPLSAKQSLRNIDSPNDRKKKGDTATSEIDEEEERLKRTKLSAQQQKMIHIKNLSQKLVPIVKGKSIIAAKELYNKQFPSKLHDEFGEFFISNPNSMSRKLTASQTIHHHGSKTLDALP